MWNKKKNVTSKFPYSVYMVAFYEDATKMAEHEVAQFLVLEAARVFCDQMNIDPNYQYQIRCNK